MTELSQSSVRAALDALPEAVRSISQGLDHLGVAVRSVEESLILYRELLGLEFLYEETVESDGVRVAVLDLGSGHLELLEATNDNSPIAAFLERRGEGLHHLALAVDDCAQALRVCAEAGLRLIDTRPRSGAGGKVIGFLHPKSTGGVLLELCQRADESH
jgi:methylmalonyl-CoA epimerase